jgi:predicted transcriptional regulator
MAKVSTSSALVDLFPKDFLVSIKPEYVNAIVDGRKTVELRKKFPEDVANGSRAYIYSSSPVQAVVAVASLERVDRLPLEELWEFHGRSSCIDRATFDEYFGRETHGCGILLGSVRPLASPIERRRLHDLLGVIPPQSFMYLPSEFERCFRNDIS